MDITNLWRSRGRSRLLRALAVSTVLFSTGATLPTQTPIPIESQLADLTIYVPVEIPGYPIIVVPRRRVEQEREVTLRFVAQGEDWATVYLDGRTLFRALNNRRDYTVTLEPGAYYLEIGSTNRFEIWHAGYLDVGRDDSNVIVVRYGKDTGIQVSGSPYVWIPD